MPTIVTAECASVEMRYVQDGQHIENVYHVMASASPPEAELIAIATIFKDWWVSDQRLNCAANVSLNTIVVKDLSALSGTSIEYSVGLPSPGTGVSPALPNNATLAIKWTTGLGGRSYRGRTYHIGLQQADVIGNTVQPGSIAALTSNYAALLASLNTASHQLVVVSTVVGGTPRAVGLKTPILALSIDPTVDSQRRRLPGRGQ